MVREIDAWLNVRLFKQTDLHLCFKKLHKCGADLEYVLFLCRLLRVGDHMRSLYASRGILPISRDRFPDLRIDQDVERFLATDQCTIDELNAKLLLIDALIRLSELKVHIFQLLLNFAKESWDKYERLLNSLYDSGNPLLYLLDSFCRPKNLFNEKGDPGDRWGSFFLLAVTEHLSTTERRKPNHRLAYDLLAAVRCDSVPVQHPQQNVATRIAQLKKAEPECYGALEMLRSAFLIAPEYCESFLAAQLPYPSAFDSRNVK